MDVRKVVKVVAQCFGYMVVGAVLFGTAAAVLGGIAVVVAGQVMQ